VSVALFLSGGVSIEAGPRDRTALLNLCLVRGYPYTGFCCTAEGGILLRFSARTARRVLDDCKAREISVGVTACTGLPFFFLRLLKRPGFLVGIVLAVFLLFLSERFVWEIRITGNEEMGNDEICEILRESGLYVGTYLPALDVPSMENRVLISTNRLSWVSVNLDGTVANVQVIEAIPKGDAEGTLPANLIASRDGQIEYLELFRGESAVKVGQAVKKGELLVSGVMESERAGCRFTRASGRVMARTERILCINVPLTYTEKVYDDEKVLDITLNFFDFSMKIFKSTGNVNTPCDIIEKESVPTFFGTHVLPLSLSFTVADCYTEETKTRTAEEAVSQAFSELDSMLAALSAEAEILSKSISQRMEDTGVLLECRLVCVEDIAQQQEFEISE